MSGGSLQDHKTCLASFLDNFISYTVLMSYVCSSYCIASLSTGSISSTFYVRHLHQKITQPKFTREMLREALLYKKNSRVKCWWNWHQGSISSTFYEQLLCMQTPKVQKRQSSCQSFFHFCDLRTQKLLVEHWWNWHQALPMIATAGVNSIRRVPKMKVHRSTQKLRHQSSGYRFA